MAVKRVSPDEARDLIDKEGYAYLDVRSVPGHGATFLLSLPAI